MNVVLSVMTLQRGRIWRFRWRGNNWRRGVLEKVRRYESEESLTFGKGKGTWGSRSGGGREKDREEEETGEFGVGETGAFLAEGFYPPMTFEESVTCWKWPRRRCDESFSDQRCERGKCRIIRQRVMCMSSVFWTLPSCSGHAGPTNFIMIYSKQWEEWLHFGCKLNQEFFHCAEVWTPWHFLYNAI